MKPPSLIIFDFDGVILQSAQIKTDGFAKLFEDRPRSTVDAIVALHVKYGGYSRYQKFEMIYRDILAEPLDEATSASLGARYTEICLADVLECPPVPGAIEFLEFDLGRRPHWVASGSPHDELCFTIDRRGLTGLFDEVHGSPMPKAATISRALSVTECPPDEALFVGDAWSDFVAARDSGLRFLGVVAPGDPDPFPVGTDVVPDLTHLRHHLDLHDRLGP